MQVRRRPALVVLALALVALVALLPAQALGAPLSVQALTSKLRGQKVYVQPSVKPRPNVSSLRQLVNGEQTKDQYKGWKFVVLSEPAKGTASAQKTAEAVVQEFGKTPVTVVVVVKKLGAASSQYDAQQVAAAVKATNDSAAAGDPVALMNQFASQLSTTAEPPATTGEQAAGTGTQGGGGGESQQGGSSEGGGDDGRPIWQYLLAVAAIVALAVVLLAALRSRSRDRRKRRRGGSIGTARDFHLERLERLARRHSELVRPLAERGVDDPDLQQHYETAGGKLVALRRSIPQLASPRELRTAASELDEIEWHVESAESLIAGRTPPDRPLRDRPALCFFTHLHGLATEDIDLVRPDGTITAVRVCPANARALERGEVPAVSSVHVGGREIPWPAAPTWYGAPGWTLDDLPGTEYQGREIWGRDVPRREVPLLTPEEEAAAVAAGVVPEEAALQELGDDAVPDSMLAPGGPELDPDDLAAIGGAEAEARAAADDVPVDDDAVPADELDDSLVDDVWGPPADESPSPDAAEPAPEPEPEAEPEPAPAPEPAAGARAGRPSRRPRHLRPTTRTG